ncbi:hypothetical protein IGI04_034076, partial [Brassica rapa subsp. trilocularis]
ACYLTGLVEGCNPSPTISPPQFTCERRSGLSEFSRLSREEKGKDIADSPSPAKDTDGNPLDEFELIHRDALRDTENMSLSQRLLVADAHRQFREEELGQIEDEEDVEGEGRLEDDVGSGSEALRTVVGSRRRACRGVEAFLICRVKILRFLNLKLLSFAVDWESRLPCVIGPRKSRLSLFTRKQQKLLNKAREMEGVPNLSALLKGRLQLLSKKSAPVDRSETTDSGDVGASGDRGASKEGASNSNDKGVRVEPSAPSPKKKKKDKKTTEKPADETSPLLSASLATSTKGQGTKKKKKKRARNEATSRDEGTAMDDAIPVKRSKKKTKKKAAGTEPGSSVVAPSPIDAVREDEATPNAPLEKKRKALVQRSGSGSESAGGEKSVPGSSTSRGPRLEGSLPKKGRIE